MRAPNKYATQFYETTRYDTAVEYADQHHLVYLLFSSLIDALSDTERHIVTRDWYQKGRSITKAEKIIYGLQSTLDFEKGGEIARNLDALYEYCLRRLSQGNAHNDLQAIVEVKSLMHEIKEAWVLLPAKRTRGMH